MEGCPHTAPHQRRPTSWTTSLHRDNGAPGADPGRRRSGSPDAKALWWTLALGADLGRNATAVGASANVVIIRIAARNGHPISFWHFTRYGVVVVGTIAVAWVSLWLRYYPNG
jgi:Na+/H+ antiporter NhaD/arsenite permease-like protein